METGNGCPRTDGRNRHGHVVDGGDKELDAGDRVVTISSSVVGRLAFCKGHVTTSDLADDFVVGNAYENIGGLKELKTMIRRMFRKSILLYLTDVLCGLVVHWTGI